MVTALESLGEDDSTAGGSHERLFKNPDSGVDLFVYGVVASVAKDGDLLVMID